MLEILKGFCCWIYWHFDRYTSLFVYYTPYVLLIHSFPAQAKKKKRGRCSSLLFLISSRLRSYKVLQENTMVVLAWVEFTRQPSAELTRPNEEMFGSMKTTARVAYYIILVLLFKNKIFIQISTRSAEQSSVRCRAVRHAAVHVSHHPPPQQAFYGP